MYCWDLLGIILWVIRTGLLKWVKRQNSKAGLLAIIICASKQGLSTSRLNLWKYKSIELCKFSENVPFQNSTDAFLSRIWDYFSRVSSIWKRKYECHVTYDVLSIYCILLLPILTEQIAHGSHKMFVEIHRTSKKEAYDRLSWIKPCK